jgi:GBP family porin
VRSTSNDSHFIRASAEYNLSKRTQIFANIVGLKNKGTASQAFYGNGAPGRDQNVFSLGLRNLF